MLTKSQLSSFLRMVSRLPNFTGKTNKNLCNKLLKQEKHPDNQ